VSVWMCVNEYTLYTLYIRFVNRECTHKHTHTPHTPTSSGQPQTRIFSAPQ